MEEAYGLGLTGFELRGVRFRPLGFKSDVLAALGDGFWLWGGVVKKCRYPCSNMYALQLITSGSRNLRRTDPCAGMAAA